MMPVSIAGKEFRVAPTEYNWDYTLKMSSTKTLGGKVIQIYGVRMGDLRVMGTFSTPAEQQEWFTKLKAVVDSQVPVLGRPRPGPTRFFWPERGMDFMVFIKEFTQEGAATSIAAKNDLASIPWALTLFIEQDNSGIVKVAQQAAEASYIRRISAGLGWQQSEWNGPVVNEEFQAALDAREVLQYLYDERERAIANEYQPPAPTEG